MHVPLATSQLLMPHLHSGVGGQEEEEETRAAEDRAQRGALHAADIEPDIREACEVKRKG